MKNEAVKKMLAKQHLVPVEDVDIEFISVIDNTYEFKATVRNNDFSIKRGFSEIEVLKVIIKSEPWADDI